jgi:hypothetical protein
MTETWKDIPGYEGHYQVSDLGRVRSVDRRVRTVAKNGAESTRAVPGCLLSASRHSQGYLQVKMGARTYIVGPLVLAAFVGPRPDGMECAHGDGAKTNNALTNLRWATPAENSADRIRHGTSGKGAENAGAKLTPAQVQAVRESTGPQGVTAALFGVTQATVSKIKLRQRWGHL